MRILIAGELNPDLIMRDYNKFPTLGEEVLVNGLLLTLGSSSAICAVGLARLGDDVTFAANVGRDPYGDFCVAALERERVDVSLVGRRPDLETGITVSITSAADRALVTYPGSMASLCPQDLPAGVFAGHAHFHVSSYFLQDGLRPHLKQLFAAARRAGLTTSLDTGYDPSEQWSADVVSTLDEVDVFLPNESELRGISRREGVLDGLRALDNGHTLIVAKLGLRGCAVWRDGKLIEVPTFPAKAVDPTGAGDSFNAGFLHAWLRHAPLADCLRTGAACGALSTRALGGTTAQPNWAEVQDLLSEVRAASPAP
jgi:sugar/nucleoside kinase (ribokinase family)